MPRTFEIYEFPLWEKLRGKHVPLSFDLEITPRCNYNCRHCYINLPANDAETQGRELTLAEIKRIAQEALETGAVWCLITGGEPLLRKDFPDIYLLLKRLGFLVSVFTNASLITSEHAALFKKYPPRDIEVTVYGASKETHERVTRCPNSFAAFQRGLNLLVDSGVKVRLKAMVLRSNIHEFEEISVFCLERTKDFYRSDVFLSLRNDRDPVRNADIQAERLSTEEIFAVADDAKRFNSLKPADERKISQEHRGARQDYLFQCGAGQDSFSVSFDGYLRLCSTLCHPDCQYNLRQGGLIDAWQNFIPHVRSLRSKSQEYLKKCGRCELAMTNICRWCPAKAYLETGEMDRPIDYFCRIAQAQATTLSSSGTQKRTVPTGDCP